MGATESPRAMRTARPIGYRSAWHDVQRAALTAARGRLAQVRGLPIVTAALAHELDGCEHTVEALLPKATEHPDRVSTVGWVAHRIASVAVEIELLAPYDPTAEPPEG